MIPPWTQLRSAWIIWQIGLNRLKGWMKDHPKHWARLTAHRPTCTWCWWREFPGRQRMPFFLLLVPKNIPSVLLLITMSLIIYGMWKIKQKASKFITNLGLQRDRSSLKAKNFCQDFVLDFMHTARKKMFHRLDCGGFSCLSNQKRGKEIKIN